MKVEITQLRDDLRENLFELKITKYYKNSMIDENMTLYLTFGELTDLDIVINKILQKKNV